MHMTVGTSLAIIIPTSLFSSWAHHKKLTVNLGLIRGWGLFVAIGAIYGAWLATFLNSDELKSFFAVMALLMGIKLILGKERTGGEKKSINGILGKGIATLIGGLSSVMGIGGATFSVPIMTFYGFGQFLIAC